MSRTPARQMASTPEPSALDRDDIQEILSSFYLGDGAYSESGSEENEVYPSDSERSHSHCGRDELEARELYDLYGDDESENGGRHDDDDGAMFAPPHRRTATTIIHRISRPPPQNVLPL
ncbi:hypothetical protein PM082_022600 [Marasmius tenuissimus]|nr:hypothetical protein PM082_022600 [Marasmius tenuissimus]